VTALDDQSAQVDEVGYFNDALFATLRAVHFRHQLFAGMRQAVIEVKRDRSIVSIAYRQADSVRLERLPQERADFFGQASGFRGFGFETSRFLFLPMHFVRIDCSVKNCHVVSLQFTRDAAAGRK
jgi:hypothetical protein